MDSDNLMPNEGEQFQPVVSEELDQDLRSEKTMVQGAGKDLITHMIELIETDIALLNTLTGLNSERKLSIESQIEGRQLAVDLLTASRDHLVNLRDAHIKY